MELVGHYQKRSAISGVSITVPRLVWCILSMLMTITVLVFSVTMTFRREISNPFPSYPHWFGDNARQAAIDQGFICRDAHPQTYLERCIQANPDEIFSRQYLWLAGSAADTMLFIPREHTLTLGDLSVLWGKPEIHVYCETVVASWHAQHIMARVETARRERPDYFASVQSISFTRSTMPHWAQVMKNDALHGCA